MDARDGKGESRSGGGREPVAVKVYRGRARQALGDYDEGRTRWIWWWEQNGGATAAVPGTNGGRAGLR